MRLRQLFEDGRIVKGVNTTVDVSPGEIKTQAAKFGNTVDRDGRPPTLSKKVKGKSTNVLYNLGLTESVELIENPLIILAILARSSVPQLSKRGLQWLHRVVQKNFKQPLKATEKEAKKIEDILKKMETQATKKDRYEANVRAGEYMDQRKADAAAKALDQGKKEIAKILKNISKNESIEEKWSKKYKSSINCSNPKGFSQKAHCAGRKKKESYSREELPQIKNKHLENIDHEIVFLNIDEVVPVQKERVMENFKRQVDRLVEGKYSPVIVDCHNRIVNGHHRYDAIRLLGQTTIPVARIPHTLECIIENFADGKKKGKSRPGRVKKAGASCKGSVTSLRKKAAKYSGEKGKMYHWCANMKGGKKK